MHTTLRCVGKPSGLEYVPAGVPEEALSCGTGIFRRKDRGTPPGYCNSECYNWQGKALDTKHAPEGLTAL